MTLDPVGLLAQLIEAKSYSGHEGPAADALCAALANAGAAPKRVGDSVVCVKGCGVAGLLLNSHLDTVPATDRWTRDPWRADIEDDRIYGLGATDAKSCVAAMAAAFVAAPDPGARGRLVFTATTMEETGGLGQPNGMEQTLPETLPLAGAIVGEPTQLNICHGQRGLVRLVLHVEGRAGHASRPWEGVNAIEEAADDIVALRRLAGEIGADLRDPVLGPPTIQPTLMQAGSAKNVIPDAAEITLDIRTTQTCDNGAIIDKVRAAVAARVDVLSDRFQPVATEPGAAIIRAAADVLDGAELKAFGGVSDLFFLRSIPTEPIPCCLIGPGDGRQSHQPDEFVSVAMVRRAAEAYAAIARRFWELAPDGD